MMMLRGEEENLEGFLLLRAHGLIAWKSRMFFFFLGGTVIEYLKRGKETAPFCSYSMGGNLSVVFRLHTKKASIGIETEPKPGPAAKKELLACPFSTLQLHRLIASNSRTITHGLVGHCRVLPSNEKYSMYT